MKICNNCHLQYEEEKECCPYCGYGNNVTNNKVDLIMNLANVKDDSDTTMRLENVPLGGYQSLNEDYKGALAISIILLVLSIFPGSLFFFQFITLKADLNSDFLEKSKTSVYIKRIPFIVISLVILFLILILIIKFIYVRKKIKKLQKCGVVLKNTPFIIITNGALMRVKVVYKDEFGNTHIFKGLLPKYAIRNGVCDVIFNPNNYKQYFVRYNIS